MNLYQLVWSPDQMDSYYPNSTTIQANCPTQIVIDTIAEVQKTDDGYDIDTILGVLHQKGFLAAVLDESELTIINVPSKEVIYGN